MNKGKVIMRLDESKYDKSLQVSQGGVQQAADALYGQVLEGTASAIQVAEMINFMAKVGEAVKGKSDEQGKNAFVDLVRSEIRANSSDDKKYTTKYGTVLELAETGVSYTYKACGDPLWNYYTYEIEKLKKLKETREKFLKTITQEFPVGNVLIPETGELHEEVVLFPPIKTSISSFKQSLAKD